MSDFMVNIPKLRDASTEFEEIASYLESIIAEISGLGSGVGGCLSGECVRGIEEQLRQLSEELADGKRAVDSLGSGLVTIADAYESTEKEVVSSAQNCKSDQNLIIEETETVESQPLLFGSGFSGNAQDQESKVVRTALMQDAPPHMTYVDKFHLFLYKVVGRIFEKGKTSYEIRLSDGSIRYNWTKISNTLRKSASEITPEEYAELSGVFLDMDEKSAARFLELLAYSDGTIHKDDSFFPSSCHYPNDYEVWRMDYNKISRFQASIRVYSDAYDFYNIDWDVVKKETGLDEIPDDLKLKIANAYGIKQNQIIQKAALLDVCGMFCDSYYTEDPSDNFFSKLGDGYFTSEPGAVSPGFSVKYVADGTIKFSYRSTLPIRPLSGGADDYYHLIEKTFTIGQPGSITNVRDVSGECYNYFNEFYSPDISETLGSFIVNSGIGIAASSVPVVGPYVAASSAISAGAGIVLDQFDNSSLNDAHNMFYRQTIEAANTRDFGMVSVPVSIGEGESIKNNKITITYPTPRTEAITQTFSDVLKDKRLKITINGQSMDTITYETVRDHPMEINEFLSDEKNQTKLRPVLDFIFNPYMERSVK